MLKELDDYDWCEAFGYCGDPQTMSVQSKPNVDACTGDKEVSTELFSREDVIKIISKSEGINDELPWVGIFELKDGRFAFLSAGCDYTGWDCIASGAAIVSNDLSRLIQFGVGDAERERLFEVAEPY